MDTTFRPYRSVLYIPGSKERALDKARGLACDAIIFDLEDAVTPDAKDSARETLKTALAEGGYGERAKIIRINGLDTDWGADDVKVLKDAGADAFLLPKVNSVKDIEALVNEARRSVTRIERAISQISDDPQSLIFGGSGSVKQYDGRRRR